MTAQERIEQLTMPASNQTQEFSISKFLADSYDEGLKKAAANHPAETRSLKWAQSP